MDPAKYCLDNHLYGDTSPTLRFCKFCRKAMCEICYNNHYKQSFSSACAFQAANQDTIHQFPGVPLSRPQSHNVVPPQDINMVPVQSFFDDSAPQINDKQLPGPSIRHFYKPCTAHHLAMDQFCYSHCSVICQQCRCENHQGCSVKDVEHVCLELDITTVSELRKSLNKIRMDAIEVKTFLSRNLTDLEKQKQAMVKKLKKAHEDVLKEVDRKFEETKLEIEKLNEKYTSELCAYVCHINSILDGLDLCLKDTRPLEGRHMEVGIFLKYQEILSSNSQIPSDLQNLYNKIKKVKISFKDNKRFQPLMEKSAIGNINVTTTKYSSLNPHQEINCPLFVSQPVLIREDNSVAAGSTTKYTSLNPVQELNGPLFVSQPEVMREINSVTAATTTKYTSINSAQEINGPLLVSQPDVIRADQPASTANNLCSKIVRNESGETYQYVKAIKDRELNVRCGDDYKCWITGFDVTQDGRLLMADVRNKKIKMLTADRQKLLQLQLDRKCYNITIYNETTAVVAGGHNLFFIDISEGGLAVKKTIRVDYNIYAIQTCGNNLLVTYEEDDYVQSVKLITTAGNTLWSDSKDQRGHDIFLWPDYITCYRDQSQCKVVVTDCYRNYITVLDGNTGNVIKVIDVEGKGPGCVTSDNNGNFYICYCHSDEMVIWNKDLTSSRVLCTTRPNPLALGYDSFRNQLIVSYDDSSDEVECYQLQ